MASCFSYESGRTKVIASIQTPIILGMFKVPHFSLQTKKKCHIQPSQQPAEVDHGRPKNQSSNSGQASFPALCRRKQKNHRIYVIILCVCMYIYIVCAVYHRINNKNNKNNNNNNNYVQSSSIPHTFFSSQSLKNPLVLVSDPEVPGFSWPSHDQSLGRWLVPEECHDLGWPSAQGSWRHPSSNGSNGLL